MDPGEFNVRVTLIQDVQVGRDAAGAPIIERHEVAWPWAKITYPGGREFLQNDGQAVEKKALIRIYARKGVDTDTTIQAAGSTWDIKDIRPFDDVLEIHAVAQ
ncbi:MAG: phage head closure protein [Brevundimonas sp.]|uniref:phage head closure protein n=1 Tax=Brevundimonas sp. TaxID=1871086 RepID=UPI0039189F5B